MTELKIMDVIGYTSEDPKYPAQNLLLGKKWLCAQTFKLSSNQVTLRLEKCAVISAIDIGNCGSSFITIDVSRVGLNEFENLVPTTVFMNQKDCKTKTNLTAVQMFMEEKLVQDVRVQKWDVVRVLCSQPFSQGTQFGLSFIRIMTFPECQAPAPTSTDKQSFRSFMEKHISPQRSSTLSTSRTHRLLKAASLPTSPASQSEAISHTTATPKTLTENEYSPSSRNHSATSLRTKNSMNSAGDETDNVGRARNPPARTATCTSFSNSEENLDMCHETRLGLVPSPKENGPQFRYNSNTVEKRQKLDSPPFRKAKKEKPASDSDSLGSADTIIYVQSSPESVKSSKSVQMDKIVLKNKGAVTKRVKRKLKDEPGISRKLTQCPLCTEFFDSSIIMDHAALCNPETDDTESRNHLGGGNRGSESPESTTGHKPLQQCPLCSEFFPQNHIEDHAAVCEPRPETSKPCTSELKIRKDDSPDTSLEPDSDSEVWLTARKAKGDTQSLCKACGGWLKKQAPGKHTRCSCVRVERALVHAPQSPEKKPSAFIQCPLCLEFFHQNSIGKHAAMCSSDRAASGVRMQLKCPVCHKMYPQGHMRWHIRRCGQKGRDCSEERTSTQPFTS